MINKQAQEMIEMLREGKAAAGEKLSSIDEVMKLRGVGQEEVPVMEGIRIEQIDEDNVRGEFHHNLSF